jgi:hypothetical protein
VVRFTTENDIANPNPVISFRALSPTQVESAFARLAVAAAG